MSMPLPKSRRKWQPTSILVVICGVMAGVYFIYRIGLVAVPTVALGNELLHPQQAPASLVCGEEGGQQLADPLPELSANYQKHVREQKALSPNLVSNSSLAKINQDTNQPQDYEESVTGKSIRYQFLRDGDKPFLRVTDKTKRAPDAPAPAWLMNAVTTERTGTYRYEFEYRSTVPAEVTLEYRTSANKRLHYTRAAVLPRTDTWQRFTAHVDNSESMTSLRVIVNGNEAGRVDTRGYHVTQIPSAELKKGMVSVTFDDGWQGVSTKARPLLEKYHIRSTLYIISDVSAHGEPDYMNFPAITDLKNAGHEIGSHTLTHCNQTTLSADQITRNAVESKQQLEMQGFGPVRSFAYPLGQYDAKTQAIYPTQYAYIRTSDAGYNDRYFDTTDIHSMGILNTTTEKELQSWLNYAKAHKQWVVLVYHRIDASGAYNVTSQQLDQQLGMVARSGLDVRPLSEAGDTIKAEAPKASSAKPKPSNLPGELPQTGMTLHTTDLAGVVGLLVAVVYFRQSERDKKYGTGKR